MKEMFSKTLVGLLSVLLLFSLADAIEKKEQTAIKTDKVPSAIQATKCPDLEAGFTLTKTKSGKFKRDNLLVPFAFYNG